MILVDTGPLVALVDAADQFHAHATQDLEKLAAESFMLGEACLVEAAYMLSSDHSRLRLRELVIEELEMELLVPVDPHRFLRDVFQWMHKYAEHAPDYSDAWIAVMSGQNSRLKVWTYDSEFRTIWRKPDGSAIPLALGAPRRSR